MIFLEALCDNISVLKIIMFVNKILGVLFWLIPMILIVMASIDLAKNVISREDEMSKHVIHVIQRVVMAIFIFLLPNVINLFNSIVDNTSFSACMKNADSIYVKNLELSKATKESLEKINSPHEVDLSSGSKLKVIKAKKRKNNSSSNSSSGLPVNMFGVLVNGKIPDGDEYYPLDGKNKKGKLLSYLEIDGKFLSDDEQDKMKKFIRAAVKSSNNWNDRVGLAAWSLVYGLSEYGLKMHYFKGNRTWGVGDTVDPVGTCNSNGWCPNWGRFASAQAINTAIGGYGYVNAYGDSGKSKYYTGMGCDGFGRWAIITSGCGHDLIADKYLKQDRETFSRTSDYSSGNAGDMLMTGQGNGHTRIFLKYDKKKKAVLTVEATSCCSSVGLFFHYYPVSELKAGAYEVVSMGKGYEKYCNKKKLKK